MLIILFSEIHRGSVIYSEGTNDRFKSCTSLYAFRKNCHNNNISFRRALTKISKILRHTIKNSKFKDAPANDASFQNLGIDSQLVHCITKQTCHSPKHNHLHRLKNDSKINHEIVKRFKHCPGKPVLRVSDIDKSLKRPGGRGTCIVCKKLTHWYCVLCRNWACHHKTESDIKYIVDVHEAKEGNRITAVKSCFIDCHPIFL